MPIVDVTFVFEAQHLAPSGFAQEVANQLGTVFAAQPGRVWVRFHALPSDAYAENASAVAASELPVFVTVLAAKPPSGAELATQVAAVTHAVAEAANRKHSQVHVEYAPAGAGRMAFGGTLVQ